MNRFTLELPCPVCSKPTDDPDGLVCSDCKRTLEQRKRTKKASANPIPKPDVVHCPRCGNPKEPHSGEWCVACTAAFAPIFREHLERTKEARRQLFLGLGRDAAGRFLEAVSFAYSADLSTDDMFEALAAWSEGLSTACGISEAEAKAEFARVVAARMDLFKPKAPLA
jgi:hypothetical protein